MLRFYFSIPIFLFSLALGGVFAFGVSAQTETQKFFVENSYDLFGRKEVETQLVRADSQLYFYVETSWWNSRSAQEQNDLRIAFAELGLEFQKRIYPVLTSTFGSEPKSGIDRDEKITVLIHQMGGEAGGYFRSGDVYERLISVDSNEREMVYLNSRYIGKPEAKSFLAHEFTHLITVNQKDLLRRGSEEVWLNEARAEYAPTLLGYDNTYQGSNLERRVRDFLSEPSNSLTDWLNQKEDYGAVNLFAQYLVDHYGVGILVDSLHSPQVGIASLNEALQKNGIEKDVVQIFEDWAIAVLVNDCTIGERYCYKNKHLINLRVTPALYVLPSAETIFSTYHTAAPWSARWHKLVGGGENLVLEFTGNDFRVPYVLCGSENDCSVKFFSLDEEQKGEITLSEFDNMYNSLTLIPFVPSVQSAQKGEQHSFSWQVNIQRKREVEEEHEAELVSELLARVVALQEQIRQLQSQLAFPREQNGPRAGGFVSCKRFERNLSFGAQSEEVRCLQEFLVGQGAAVYPEGFITGNFLALTRQAVIRFQEKYASDILTPFGLIRGTGYVGQMTRNKINQLLGSLAVL